MKLNYRAGQRRNIWKSSNVRTSIPAARDRRLRTEGPAQKRLPSRCQPPPVAPSLLTSGSAAAEPFTTEGRGARRPAAASQGRQWLKGHQALYPHLLSEALILNSTNKMYVLLPKTEHKLMSPAGKNNKQMC